MNYIFWGFFFIVFNINIHFGATLINFIPNFIGYILMIKGIDTLKHLVPRFEKIRGFCIGMAVLTSFIFVIALLGISGRFNALFIPIRLLSFTIGLYPQYHILRGLKDLAQKKAVSSEKYMPIRLWIIVAIGYILGYLVLYFAAVLPLNVVVLAPLNFVILLMMFGGGVVFMFFLYQEKRALETSVLQDQSSDQNNHS